MSLLWTFAEATANGNGSSSVAIIDLFMVLILTVILGLTLISRVPPTLHTPLMSATNAIHGVILVGGMILLSRARTTAEIVIGFIAVLFGTLNVVGGFAVTDRMLEMFKKRTPVKKE
jgi:NAD(P) transhydrogenase subunit alpha